VALAGAIVPGVARFIVMLSAQAEVFGVGITAVVGSMLVLTSCVTVGWIVPGDGLGGICGVESGKAAPLVGGPPGMELHTVVDELPTGGADDMVPVVLPTINVGMVPNAVDDVIAIDGMVVVDGVTVLAAIDVETALGPVDGAGTGVGVMEDGGGAGITGGGGTGTVEPGKSDMNDVAGCADSVRNGAVVLSDVGVEEVAGTTEVGVEGIDPVAPPAADKDVTGTAGVRGVI
jgi:hypothetical protein